MRLLCPYAWYTGAHVMWSMSPTGSSRLYELTVGQATAVIARACLSTPAVKW